MQASQTSSGVLGQADQDEEARARERTLPYTLDQARPNRANVNHCRSCQETLTGFKSVRYLFTCVRALGAARVWAARTDSRTMSRGSTHLGCVMPDSQPQPTLFTCTFGRWEGAPSRGPLPQVTPMAFPNSVSQQWMLPVIFSGGGVVATGCPLTSLRVFLLLGEVWRPSDRRRGDDKNLRARSAPKVLPRHARRAGSG